MSPHVNPQIPIPDNWKEFGLFDRLDPTVKLQEFLCRNIALIFVFKCQRKLEGLQIYLDLGFGYPHLQFDPKIAQPETSAWCRYAPLAAYTKARQQMVTGTTSRVVRQAPA